MFNALLLLVPVLAASAVSGAFAMRQFPEEPTPAALEETRAQLDKRMASLVPRDADARAYWADLVDRELRAGDMVAARGFLLAAPNMLEGRDVRAIRQAARQLVRFGTHDDRLVGAGLLFLPNDVRARYEAAIRPPELAIGRDIPGLAPDETAAETELSQATPPRDPFSVLGSPQDLVLNSREWLRDTPNTEFALRVSGLALIAEEMLSAERTDVARVASILKAANRAGRLDPAYRERLSAALDEALPTAPLRTRLAKVTQQVAPPGELAGGVLQAFRETLETAALEPFLREARQIEHIAHATSAISALDLIEHAGTSLDMRKLRLIAQAGRARAVALENQIGRDILSTARTGVSMSTESVLEVMGLAAATMGLLWLSLAMVHRNFFPPKSRSLIG